MSLHKRYVLKRIARLELQEREIVKLARIIHRVYIKIHSKMMFKFIITLAVLATVASFFNQQIICRKSAVQMSIGDKIGKFVGIAAMGVALAGPVVPLPAIADGAVSASTVFRSRTKYGPKILSLVDSASKGDFAAFEEKKTVNAFDLFISSSNALGGKVSKERKAVEKSLEAQIYSAVKAKDAAKLTAAIKEFVAVADLKSDYKEGELGQTDSSGYSPTWGTSRQYIYQR